MDALFYLICAISGFCIYVGAVVPVALVVYYKCFKRSKKSVKQILAYINF